MLRRFSFPSGISSMAFVGEGNALLVASGWRTEWGPGGTVALLDLRDGSTRWRRDVVACYEAISANEQAGDIYALDRYHFDVLNLTTGSLRRSSAKIPWGVAFAVRGRFAAVAAQEPGRVVVLDLPSLKQKRVIPIDAQLDLRKTHSYLLADVPAIISAAPNGEPLVSTDSVREWVGFSADGSVLFVNNTPWSTTTWTRMDATVIAPAVDLSPAQIAWVKCQGQIAREHLYGSVCLAFSPDGNTFATGGSHVDDGNVIVWSAGP